MISPASMPHHRPTPADQPLSSTEPVFVDTTTGETGIMLQRSDAVFCFHPHDGGPPRAILEPGRYRSTEDRLSTSAQPRRRRPGRRGRRNGPARQ